MLHVEKTIQKLFQTRDQTHSFHWTTKSYAAHTALGSYYGDLLSSIDEFMEAYMGKHPDALVRRAKIPMTISVEPDANPDGMIGFYTEFNAFLDGLCSDLTQAGDGDLEHIVLDMKNATNTLLYLLKLK